MPKHPCLTALAAAALASVSALAGAQDSALAQAADSAFNTADFDGDGKVSWEEFRNRLVRVFGHLDHNEDGRIAGEEHPPAVDAAGKAVQPGNVTAEAFAAAMAETFKAADTDGDGALSPQEWSGRRP